MKRLLLLTALSSPLWAQAILDDWAGASITAVASASGGPTTITTAHPHGLITGMCISIFGATPTGANGQWVNMNNQQDVYFQSSMSTVSPIVYVNETNRLEPTGGSTWYIYSRGGTYPGVTTADEYITIASSNPFPTARTIAIGTRGVNSTSNVNHVIGSQITGPALRPAGYAITKVPVSWTITNVDATHFTIPLDSSSFGSFSGQTVFYERATCSGYPTRLFHQFPGDGSTSQQDVTANGTLQLVIAGCPNHNDALGCSLAYNNPTGFRGYGSSTGAGSLVVSGGTGTIHLTTNFVSNSPGVPFAVGQLAWLWNYNDANGGGLPFGTINRPWFISSIAAESPGQTLTFQNMGCSGSNPGQGAGSNSSLGECVPDGTYNVNGQAPNFFLPLSADYYSFWFGATTTGRATLANYAQNPEPAEYPSHMVLSTGDPYSPTFNRFRTWWKWGATFTDAPMNWGTYGFAAHMYHNINMDGFAGQWSLLEYTAIPNHIVGQVSNSYIPQGDDPLFNGWTGYASDGFVPGTYHYMDVMNAFYLNMPGSYAALGAQTAQIGPMYYDEVDARKGGAEPDEWTPARFVTYNPGTGRYHVSVAVPGTGEYAFAGTGTSKVTYDFFHCTADPRSVGLSSASCTSDGTGTSTVGAAYSSQATIETSPVSLASTMYIGIRPHVIVNAVSSGTSGNVTLGFQADPNMAVGDHVTIMGIGGNTGANQTNVTLSAVQPRHFFWLTTPGTETAGELISITSDDRASVCTVNVTVQPNVFVNQFAWVSGAIGFGTTDPNNVYASKITGVGTNKFTINCPSGTVANTTYSAGGCSSHSCSMAVLTEPFVTLNATNNGTWDGRYNGIMVSTENAKNFAEIAFTPPSGASSSTPPVSACDLNGDGVVNSQDIQLAIEMVLGNISCTAAVCNVVMVQNVINAADGGPCLIGGPPPPPA
jgi:hypothetical protein